MPATPIAKLTWPSRHGRPNVSVMTTASETPVACSMRCSQRFRRGVRVDRQQRDRAQLLDVRGVDAGVRADEAVLRLADHHAVVHAHDARALAQHDLDDARVLLPLLGDLLRERARLDASSRSTMRPSAFETTFCVTTRTSPSSNARPWRCAAPRMSAARSSPGRTSGMPSMAMMRTLGASWQPRDAHAGGRLVALVHADEQHGDPLDVARRGERPAVDGAHAADLPRRAPSRRASRRRRRRRR